VIADNVARVRERIHRAAARAGRDPGSVRLVAVTKTMPAATVAEGVKAGLRLFGENRVQEARDKIPAVAAAAATALSDVEGSDVEGSDVEGLEWHLIGHLQSNKAAVAARFFDAVQTVDSLSLAQRLDAAAAARQAPLQVLVQVRTSDEESKSGVAPGDLRALAEGVAQLPHLRLTGLMTIPAPVERAEDARGAFASLAELASKAASWRLPGVTMRELSMGMSDDFEVAIEKGATLVRVGRALFGERT